jgi:hypothetical protein
MMKTAGAFLLRRVKSVLKYRQKTSKKAKFPIDYLGDDCLILA